MRLQSEFHPKEIYPNLNFTQIKSRLSLLTDNHEDYGSLILLKHDDFAISINSIGKVILFYDVYNKQMINKTLNIIEDAFQEEVCRFEILH